MKITLEVGNARRSFTLDKVEFTAMMYFLKQTHQAKGYHWAFRLRKHAILTTDPLQWAREMVNHRVMCAVCRSRVPRSIKIMARMAARQASIRPRFRRLARYYFNFQLKLF